jgi:ribosome biogenesis GTPase
MLLYIYNRMVLMQNNQNNTLFISYGWKAIHDAHFTPFTSMGYFPGRIIREGRGIYRAISPAGELLVQRSGAFCNLQDLGVQPSPVIGDWCAISPQGEETGRIEAILPRISEFHRPLGSHEHIPKVVAANIDKAAIVQDGKFDFNVRRIERFLSLLQADRIPSMLILTKADLMQDLEAYRRRVETRFPDCPLYVIDSISGYGINTLLPDIEQGKTLMLIGTSGAGKSTLINRLCGNNLIKTASIREKDGRGRHTTTARCIHRLPHGALVLDTPGVRMVGMHHHADSIHASFADIVQFATSCKFNDCTHQGEPGCAVQQAVRDGFIEQDRYFNFLRLMQETQSWEDVLRQSKEKKRTIGTIKYQLRRSEKR